MTIRRRDVLAGALGGLASLPAAAAALAQDAPPPDAPPPEGAAEASKTVRQVAAAREAGALELAMVADAPSTPTGIAVSREKRVFVMMPRFDASVPYTLGEVAPDGRVTPYPDMETNRPDRAQPQARLFHVPNGVFAGDDAFWVLDAGLPEGSGEPVPNGGAKLVEIDLAANMVRRVLSLDAALAPTSSLNDLRVGRLDGRAVAFVTDQGQTGEGAIIAVDIASGRAVRRLAGHASTASQPGIVKFVEHRPVMRTASGRREAPKGGANGIALSPDGRRLYYAPLMGRHLYAVPTADLLDPARSDEAVAAAVEDLGEKGMTGGLAADSVDRVYLALQEQNAVGRRLPDGTIEVIASDPRLVWADTFSITPDRWLYVNGAQVNRRPDYNDGRDLQERPYAIFRMRIDAGPA